jgi:colanic acid biosynthesis glycosyl transferase WcaI
MVHSGQKLRILIYSANFAPEPTGIGKYSGEMAAWLAAHGYEVRAVAAPPYYPAWKVAPSYQWPPFTREQWCGVAVWRAPIWVPKDPRGLTRVLHLLSFAVSSFPIVLWQCFWRPDIVLTVAPAFLCAPAGLLAARLCGARSWLHLQDFEVDMAFGMGLLKGELLRSIVLRMERWVLRRFDVVSSISSRMVEHLLRKGVEPARTRYFPNWVDCTRIHPGAPRTRYRDDLGIAPQSVVALFSGSLGGKQGLMIIPQVAALLKDRRDIDFVICGDGVMKAALQAASAGLANVHLLPLQPTERLAELLDMADIHLLPQSPDAADLVLPSKLSGMLASGRPVIATVGADTEIAGIVNQCGLVVPPENRAELSAAIVRLADDRTLRLELGRSARAYAETHFARDAVMHTVFESVDNELEDAVNDIAL